MKTQDAHNSQHKITNVQFDKYLLKVLKEATIEDLKRYNIYGHLDEALEDVIVQRWQQDHIDKGIKVDWEESMKVGNNIYKIGKLKNGKYFWTWDIYGEDVSVEGALNFPDKDECYGGFIYKDFKRFMKSIQFDCLFEEDYIDDTDFHPVYNWAVEVFEKRV
jgi:hypothetical protein